VLKKKGKKKGKKGKGHQSQKEGGNKNVCALLSLERGKKKKGKERGLLFRYSRKVGFKGLKGGKKTGDTFSLHQLPGRNVGLLDFARRSHAQRKRGKPCQLHPVRKGGGGEKEERMLLYYLYCRWTFEKEKGEVNGLGYFSLQGKKGEGGKKVVEPIFPQKCSPLPR